MNEVLKTMTAHASVRKYASRDIPRDLLSEILKSAQQASTSANMQAYSVVVVRDKAKKEKFAELCGSQPWIARCPVFLVICPDLHRLQKVCIRQGYELIDKYIELFIAVTVDAALYAQNILLGAESCGLGGVMIGGIRNNPEEVSALLKLPEKVYPLMGLCLGYPGYSPMLKPRLPMETVVHFEEYDDSQLAAQLDEYDNIMRRTGLYEGRRRKIPSPKGKEVPDSEYSWSEHIARWLASDSPEFLRPHLRRFLLSRKLGLD